jgi:hypothetical protein
VWQDIQNSNVQFATASSTAFAIAVEGTKIYSAINAAAGAINSINFDANFALGSDVDGNQDVLVIGWNEINGTAANCAVSIVWREI